VQLRLQGGDAALLTRSGHDWTHRFRGLPQAARDLRADTALIDGEVVVLDDQGVSSFARLKAALSGASAKSG
jgi:bifunctional non-homologous end joining protein LigD